MVVVILVIALAFVWLLYETRWLTVRLLVGPIFFNGLISFPHFYNRVLSAEEIKEIYEHERHLFGL